ncbi:polyphenol oxidase family protein [Salinicoccus hispanicus]|uniref:Laccase domain-containing protein n=1 Tax=Salinicoccus hispanicus TaxID=157225 RepID=A0A6N8TWM4_9STAP|nr:polyphenol oxidase family protein [Salinicoccus hispanicus]MXQ49802.1 laccase domain-containing protein [Salinicoccus hispanicus]
MKLNIHKHYVGTKVDDILFGYTKRTDGYSDYPSESFNMALYIGDDAVNVHQHQNMLADEIGFAPDRWVLPIQKHGANIKEVGLDDAGTNVRELSDALHDVDGLYTYDRGLLLTMNYADCVPVHVWSSKNDFTALLHAGWRGTAHDIIGTMVREYGNDPKDLSIMIGVAINGACYTVDSKVIHEVEKVGLPSDAVDQNEAGYNLDLKTVNRHQALQAGVLPENIHVSELGTEDVEQFFSYRLEKGQTGRALAFIGRYEDDQR